MHDDGEKCFDELWAGAAGKAEIAPEKINALSKALSDILCRDAAVGIIAALDMAIDEIRNGAPISKLWDDSYDESKIPADAAHGIRTSICFRNLLRRMIHLGDQEDTPTDSEDDRKFRRVMDRMLDGERPN